MPYTETHLEINGVDTAVFTAGQGDPVVFFHGAGTATGFDCLLPIAEQHRLVVAHHPGFGSSGGPACGDIFDLARHHLDVIDHLGIGEFALIGHSMGGWTAATLATFAAERISSLVLVAPAGLHSTAHPIVDLFMIPDQEVPSYLAADMSVFGPMDGGPPPPEFLADRYRETTSWAKIAWDRPYDPRLHEWLHRLTMPTLVLWGDADRLIPVEQAKEWLTLLPNATVTTFAGSGHLLFDERPDAVAAAEEFISR